MSALICGSIAYDTIMVFHDRFRNHIIPDKLHMLSVSFMVPDMRREFGGCAGNIAYNLKLLGGAPVVMATAGRDFAPYADWLEACAIDRGHIRIIDSTFTAQAFITTDQDDNQIIAFHPGAMNFSHQNRVDDVQGVRLGIVAPDGRDGMIEHASQFAEAGIPFIFDPGQGLPMFGGDELCDFIDKATWVAVNDYEAQMLVERTNMSLHVLAERVEALIVTGGAEGSRIYVGARCIEIPVVTARALCDPTGCGDAYRAGLIYGLMNDMEWETIGRVASLAGALKVAHHGTQNHSYTVAEFHDLFHETFGYRL